MMLQTGQWWQNYNTCHMCCSFVIIVLSHLKHCHHCPVTSETVSSLSCHIWNIVIIVLSHLYHCHHCLVTSVPLPSLPCHSWTIVIIVLSHLNYCYHCPVKPGYLSPLSCYIWTTVTIVLSHLDNCHHCPVTSGPLLSLSCHLQNLLGTLEYSLSKGHRPSTKMSTKSPVLISFKFIPKHTIIKLVQVMACHHLAPEPLMTRFTNTYNASSDFNELMIRNALGISSRHVD